jgi:hypothetical protein
MAASLCLAGCTSRVPFSYPLAAVPRDAGGGSLVGAVHAVCDRRADRSIGDVYEGDVTVAISAAMRHEMLASGAFARVEALPGCIASPPLEALRTQGIDVLVQPSLDELRWDQPDHDQVIATAVAIAVVAGAVGGVAYGLTDTEVFGRTEIQATIVDARHGTSETRTYNGEVRETLDKMRADSADTRREMAARSFAAAMQAFRVDMAALAPPTP